MTTFHFQTHVSESGVITLPLPDSFRGEDITVKVDVRPKPKREISLDELCGAWCDDERTTEEIISEIYESRTVSHRQEEVSATDQAKKQERKRAFEELCDAWCADERSTEEIIRDIYESRTSGRERGPL